MKTEAMFRRLYDLPTPWARRRPRPEKGVNPMPTPDKVPFGGVLSTGPETKPLQNWYRDRCAGMGRPLGVVKSEKSKLQQADVPSTSYYMKAAKTPMNRKLTDAEKASVKKLKGIYKKLKVEGGPGSGRYPAGSHDNTPADKGIRAAKADAAALRDISNHPKLMDRINTLAKMAIKGAQNHEDVESNVADLVHRDSGLAKEIQASAKLMLGSRYDKVGKEMRYDMEDRVQRDAEEEIVARAIAHFKKGENLQVEGGPGSGRYPAGSGKTDRAVSSAGVRMVGSKMTMRQKVGKMYGLAAHLHAMHAGNFQHGDRSITTTSRMNYWSKKLDRLGAMMKAMDNPSPASKGGSLKAAGDRPMGANKSAGQWAWNRR